MYQYTKPASKELKFLECLILSSNQYHQDSLMSNSKGTEQLSCQLEYRLKSKFILIWGKLKSRLCLLSTYLEFVPRDSNINRD